jgi:hypothetical protein
MQFARRTGNIFLMLYRDFAFPGKLKKFKELRGRLGTQAVGNGSRLAGNQTYEIKV